MDWVWARAPASVASVARDQAPSTPRPPLCRRRVMATAAATSGELHGRRPSPGPRTTGEAAARPPAAASVQAVRPGAAAGAAPALAIRLQRRGQGLHPQLRRPWLQARQKRLHGPRVRRAHRPRRSLPEGRALTRRQMAIGAKAVARLLRLRPCRLQTRPRQRRRWTRAAASPWTPANARAAVRRQRCRCLLRRSRCLRRPRCPIGVAATRQTRTRARRNAGVGERRLFPCRRRPSRSPRHPQCHRLRSSSSHRSRHPAQVGTASRRAPQLAAALRRVKALARAGRR
mmetsp:Transcript_12592/g.36772  ORF Transcript_12592/g.36772 Transcript_12592/m.36772 type:complete len:287 (+) Transcript_12592:2000-2860(+)